MDAKTEVVEANGVETKVENAEPPIVDLKSLNDPATISDIASAALVPKPSDFLKDTDYLFLQDHDDLDDVDDAEIEDDIRTMKVNTHFKEEDAMLRVRTSSELLEQAAAAELTPADTLETNALKIASFIDALKQGDVGKKPTEISSSGFRARRLTSAIKVEESPKRKSEKERKSSNRANRTTIYASSEIGVKQERVPPFPSKIMGTFSCHGFEPDDDTEDGIKQKINQDRGCIVYPFCASQQEALFLVLDGHGSQGDLVAEFAMRQIVMSVEKHPKLKDDTETAFKEAFITTNTALMVTPIQYMTSGTTAVAVYVKGNVFHIANVGDSRAVIAYEEDGKLKSKMLSRDHKPDVEDERQRIVDWGGFVSPAPEPGISARVWLDNEFTLIGLAMSRSIGDHAVKNVGVIPEPDVSTHELSPADKFLILASDGVWEFIENLEAIEIVQTNLHLGAFVACQILIQTAAARWGEEEGDYRDDVSECLLMPAYICIY